MDRMVHHTCRCIGKNFTFDQWIKWLKKHDIDEVQLTFKNFNYNITDVCLTPNNPVKWKNKTCSIEISTAQSPCLRWDYGVHITIYNSGRYFSPQFISTCTDGYSTEKECIYFALIFIRDYTKHILKQTQSRTEYDDSGNIVKTCSSISGIKAAIKQLDVFIQYYNPAIKTLFDF
ncbi:hypothetical protein [Barnesiella sp. An22]|uniref:hypothetical protein n=1 Tax=Barnesiella sp. An22 TaxID=1965590 RepID=UPI0032096A87